MRKLVGISFAFILFAAIALLSVGSTAAQGPLHKLNTNDQKEICAREWLADPNEYHTITYHSYHTTLGVAEWICHGADTPHPVVISNVEDYCADQGYWGSVKKITTRPQWWNPFKKVTNWYCIG